MLRFLRLTFFGLLPFSLSLACFAGCFIGPDTVIGPTPLDASVRCDRRVMRRPPMRIALSSPVIASRFNLPLPVFVPIARPLLRLTLRILGTIRSTMLPHRPFSCCKALRAAPYGRQIQNCQVAADRSAGWHKPISVQSVSPQVAACPCTAWMAACN